MKAIVFDLFETLITEWGRPKYTTSEIAADLEVDFRLFRREWASLHRDRYLGKLSGTIRVYKKILERLGVARSEALLDEISRKRDACKRKCFEEIEPGVLRMLSALKGKGYKLGLISNCSSEETEGLRESALSSYLDAVILSCDAGVVKPDARIYELCLSALGARSENSFYVGDGGSDELDGAEGAGLRPLKAVWFTKRFVKDFDSDKRYPCFLSPSELQAFLCDGENLQPV